jgi:hypothetical protein
MTWQKTVLRAWNLHLRILEWWDYFLKDKKDIPWIDKEMKKDAL